MSTTATTKPASIKITPMALPSEPGTQAVFIDADQAFDTVLNYYGANEAQNADPKTKIDVTKPVAIIMLSGVKSQPYKVKTFGGVGSGNRYRRFATLELAEKMLKAWAKRRFRVLVPVTPTVAATAAPDPQAGASIAASVLSHIEKQAGFELYAQASYVEATEGAAWRIKVTVEKSQVVKTLNKLRSNDALFFFGAHYDREADASIVFVEPQPAGATEDLGHYRIEAKGKNNDATGCVSARSLAQVVTLTKANAAQLRRLGIGKGLTGLAFVHFGDVGTDWKTAEV